jgi:hypothetical protein
VSTANYNRFLGAGIYANVTGLLDPFVRAAPLLSPAEEWVNRFWGTPTGTCIRAAHVRRPREAAGMAHPLECVAIPSDALWSRRLHPLWAWDPLAQAPDAWHSPRGQAAQDNTPWAIRGRMGYHTAWGSLPHGHRPFYSLAWRSAAAA